MLSVARFRLARLVNYYPLLLVLVVMVFITAGGVIGGVISANRLPHLTSEHLVNLLNEENGDHVMVMVRHAERCDRSSHECLNSAQGITVRGAQQAAAMGKAWRVVAPPPYRTFSSDTVRTRQSAQGFSEGASIKVSSPLGSSSCSQPSFERFLQTVAESSSGAKVLFTHSECLAYMAQHFADTQFSPDYLEGIVLVVHPWGIRIEGAITPQELAVAACRHL